MSHIELLHKALAIREYAYVPYSKFKVGASLLTNDRTIFTGCNIENSSYPMTMCAERVAFFKAISNGYKDFNSICVVGGYNDAILEYCYPCGACLQVMAEFCTPQFQIVLFNGKDIKVLTLSELLPYKFDSLD